MKSDLRILLLEDSLLDVCLIEHELQAANLSFELVQVASERELRHELETNQPDLVLSDHGLPSFDGFTALDIVRKKSPDLPFIFVSGSNNQGMVINMYEQGATDYVYKKELGDLSPAVRRALAPRPDPEASFPIEPKTEVREVVIPETKFFEEPSARGRLLFCPQCLKARDDSGALIQMAAQLRSDGEIAFLRQLCADCQDSRLMD